jgi:hypothetical protein
MVKLIVEIVPLSIENVLYCCIISDQFRPKGMTYVYIDSSNLIRIYLQHTLKVGMRKCRNHGDARFRNILSEDSFINILDSDRFA